jgi:hypothetical protein
MASAFTPQSVISDVNVEAPDFGMLAKAAMSVQNRYLEGFNKYKSTITSMLNAKVSSDDNVKFRSEYFKKIDGYLNNLGGIDFSNPANVSIAGNLMQPLIKDTEFLTDYNNTMMQDSEMNKLESVKMSTDEKVRAQYSKDMEDAILYNMKDMRAAKRGDGSILRQSVQRYVPFADLQKVLQDAASAQKLEIGNVRITDQWIIKDKFGNNSIPSLTHWARQQLGDKYDEQLRITAKVATRRQLEGVMASNPNLSREDAYQMIAKENATGIYKNYEEYKTSLAAGVTNIDKQIADIKSRLNNKIPRGSNEEQLIANLKSLKTQYQKEIADGAANRVSKDEEMKIAFNQFMQNPEGALLPLYKDNLAKGWATAYAGTHADQDVQANPYGVAAYNASVEFEKQRRGFEHDRQMKMLDIIIKQKETEGYLTTASGEQVPADPMVDLKNELVAANDIRFKSYFDNNVLEIATSTDGTPGGISSLGMSYADIRRGLETYMTGYSQYGNNPGGNKDYANALMAVAIVSKRINPNITMDQIKKMSPIQVMDLIEYGVNQGYAGNKASAKYNEARGALFAAQTANERYEANMQRYSKVVGPIIADPILGPKFFDIKTWKASGGAIVQLNPNLTEAEKTALYSRLFPGYTPNATHSETGITYKAPKEDEFDYSAIAMLAERSSIVVDGSDPISLGEGIESDEKRNLVAALQNVAQGGGSNLKQFFSAELKIHKFNYNGQQYLKVVVPVKSTGTGENTLKGAGVTQGAVTFYVPKDDARDMWSQSGVKSTIFGKMPFSKYGPLADVYNKMFGESLPVEWMTDNLKNVGVAKFPSSYKTIYGLDDGKLQWAGTTGDAPLELTIKLNGKAPEPIVLPGITRSTFMNDPNGNSRIIDNAIRLQLEKVKAAVKKNQESAYNLHMSNYLQNPDNFWGSVDDIPMA